MFATKTIGAPWHTRAASPPATSLPATAAARYRLRKTTSEPFSTLYHLTDPDADWTVTVVEDAAVTLFRGFFSLWSGSGSGNFTKPVADFFHSTLAY